MEVVVPLLRVISDVITAIVILSTLSIINFRLVLILFFWFLLVLVLYDRLFKKLLLKHGSLAYMNLQNLTQLVSDIYDGSKEIRVYGKETLIQDDLSKINTKYLNSQHKVMQIAAAPRFLLELVLLFFIVSLLSFLTWSGGLNNIIPLMTAFVFASFRLLPFLNTISSSLVQLRYSKEIVETLSDYSENSSIYGSNRTSGIDGTNDGFDNLQLKDIGFTYDNENYIFRQVNCFIEPGDKIAILGPSGCGKSTLIDIILGFSKPSVGELRLNNVKLTSPNHIFSKLVAFVPQKTYVFSGTILDNILLTNNADREVSLENVKRALTYSGLLKENGNLEELANKQVGDGGKFLSGGQRQRIAIARAIYSGRKILILDEFTSALDSEAEDLILDTLFQKSLNEYTILFITHNENHIKYSNKKIDFKDLKIES